MLCEKKSIFFIQNPVKKNYAKNSIITFFIFLYPSFGLEYYLNHFFCFLFLISVDGAMSSTVNVVDNFSPRSYRQWRHNGEVMRVFHWKISEIPFLKYIFLRQQIVCMKYFIF